MSSAKSISLGAAIGTAGSSALGGDSAAVIACAVAGLQDIPLRNIKGDASVIIVSGFMSRQVVRDGNGALTVTDSGSPCMGAGTQLQRGDDADGGLARTAVGWVQRPGLHIGGASVVEHAGDHGGGAGAPESDADQPLQTRNWIQSRKVPWRKAQAGVHA
jgi:hypothetical protein